MTDRRGGAFAFGKSVLIARWLLAATLAASAIAVPAQQFAEPRAQRINERIIVLIGPVQHANPSNQGYMINATAIVGDSGVILVDSGGSHEVGMHIAAAVRTITAKPVMHVVNTHAHGDHHLGNSAFASATVLSSEVCRKTVDATGHEWLALMERDVGRALPGTRVRRADIAYPTGRTEVTLDGVRMVMWVPDGGAHTAGDLLVLLPDDKVLIAGDVLVKGLVPTFQDGSIVRWIALLDRIAGLDVTHFVPGHGEIMNSIDVARLRGQIATFFAVVGAGYREGRSETEIRKSIDVSQWEGLERSYVIGRNISRAFLEAQEEAFAK